MINQSKPGRTKLNVFFGETRCLKDLNRIDGEPMEFEWKIFPGVTTWTILEEIQKLMEGIHFEVLRFTLKTSEFSEELDEDGKPMRRCDDKRRE